MALVNVIVNWSNIFLVISNLKKHTLHSGTFLAIVEVYKGFNNKRKGKKAMIRKDIFELNNEMRIILVMSLLPAFSQ